MIAYCSAKHDRLLKQMIQQNWYGRLPTTFSFLAHFPAKLSAHVGSWGVGLILSLTPITSPHLNSTWLLSKLLQITSVHFVSSNIMRPPTPLCVVIQLRSHVPAHSHFVPKDQGENSEIKSSYMVLWYHKGRVQLNVRDACMWMCLSIYAQQLVLIKSIKTLGNLFNMGNERLICCIRFWLG